MTNAQWWTRKPYWSSKTNAQLLIAVLALVAIFCLFKFADDATFRTLVGLYAALRGSSVAMDLIRSDDTE